MQRLYNEKHNPAGGAISFAETHGVRLYIAAISRPANTFVGVGAGRALPLHRRTTSPHVAAANNHKNQYNHSKITVQTIAANNHKNRKSKIPNRKSKKSYCREIFILLRRLSLGNRELRMCLTSLYKV
jgi:hypothetical protein